MTCNCFAHNGFLTAKGLEEAAQRENVRLLGCYHVDDDPGMYYLDKVGSVSGSDLMVPIFDDSVLEDQYRRFHNGS